MDSLDIADENFKADSLDQRINTKFLVGHVKCSIKILTGNVNKSFLITNIKQLVGLSESQKVIPTGHMQKCRRAVNRDRQLFQALINVSPQLG